MKRIKKFTLGLLIAAGALQTQAQVSALFQGHSTPDSVVQITTVLPGSTTAQTLTVEVTDGWARIEGDIVLGRIEELQQMAQDRGVVVDGNQFRWPGGVIPYFINGGFTTQYLELIRESIDYINGAAHITLRPFVAGDTRWVTLNPATVCESAVGMQNSAGQTISLMDPFTAANGGTGCYFSAIVHEIAHAAGLWHEQSREDRNTWVTINWGNIQAGKAHNFNQHISDGIDIGPYDFGSDMHYSATAFSSNGLATITANGGQSFGNATEYSVGDVAALNWMYPTKACRPSIAMGANMRSVTRPLHYEASGTVSSQFTVANGSQVIFDAGQSIVLQPGFRATAGCTFRAVIDGCAGNIKSLTNPDEEEWLLEAENHKRDYVAPESTAPTAPADKVEMALGAFDASPNPFSETTTLAYDLIAPTEVSLRIHDINGALITTPINAQAQKAGTYRYDFSAAKLPSGVYFAVLERDGQRTTKRLVLVH